MIRRRLGSWLLLAALLAATLAAGCSGDGDTSAAGAAPPADSAASGGLYLALGDSIAAGTGASRAGETGYVGLVYHQLKDRVSDLELRDLSVPGHTSRMLVDQQLPAALDALAVARARAITVTIGGNDLADLMASEACAGDPAAEGCPLDEAVAAVTANLGHALRDLRAAAGPDVPIVVMTYPNFFALPGHPYEGPAAAALGRLDAAIREVAAEHDARVAELEHAFDGRAGELTHLLDPEMDAHPNDAGYRLIFEAFKEALGLQ